jgi:N-acetyl-gamma-glutamyl-phosphate reductase
MSMRVAVAGASGYAGGELLRLLLGHPDLEVGPLLAGKQAGRPVGEVHPQLPGLAERVFEGLESVEGVEHPAGVGGLGGPAELAGSTPAALAGVDLVFLALPHGQSARLATALPAHVKIVDLGADFRLADPGAWRRWYETPYAGHWPYGLPELPGQREVISAADRVAVPGCYPTAVVLALAPLLAAGLVDPVDIVVVAASGVSGAGRAPRPELLGGEVMGQVTAYGVGGAHRHVPEMEQALGHAAAAGDVLTGARNGGAGARDGLAHPGGGPADAENAPPDAGEGVAGDDGLAATRMGLSFTPMLAPMPRGILATCTARIRPGVRAADARAALAGAYAAEPFVHVLAEGRWPGTGATLGSNAAQLQVAVDERAGRAVVVVAIDNLGKGAAGQAVQNANLMAGLDETAGLSALGTAP